ncbi:hypothetical protein AR443_14665 [Bacillus velezensis]|nr:hypothetical protein OY17_02210 [Bacillus sp. BH072]ATY30316.1 hypothetical protein CVD07_19290 [Bacillus velezensis]AUG38048.1 hypothetical protein CXP43_20855 [Bacillus velezensis]KFI15847.1 hypothetical protein IO97_12185 [Bacillus velezensis]KOC80270.1 hypothetical protein AKJ10_13890 [Bacillus velezensis]
MEKAEDGRTLANDTLFTTLCRCFTFLDSFAPDMKPVPLCLSKGNIQTVLVNVMKLGEFFIILYVKGLRSRMPLLVWQPKEEDQLCKAK